MKINLTPTAIVSTVLALLGGGLWQVIYIDFIRQSFDDFPPMWCLINFLSMLIFWIAVWSVTPNKWWDM